MNHVSVSPTNGNGPTQGQRKTLTFCIHNTVSNDSHMTFFGHFVYLCPFVLRSGANDATSKRLIQLFPLFYFRVIVLNKTS